MSVTAIIPVKRLANAKRRLATRLSPDERATLVLRLLGAEIGTLRRVEAVARVLVVTSDPRVARTAEIGGAGALFQSDSGVNAAVELGIADARRSGAAAVIVLHGDLPFLSRPDVEAMLAASEPGVVVLAPDRHGRGTNGLAMATGSPLSPAFGPGSYALHRERARLAGLTVRTVERPGLAIDLDTAADLLVYRRRLGASSPSSYREGSRR